MFNVWVIIILIITIIIHPFSWMLLADHQISWPLSVIGVVLGWTLLHSTWLWVSLGWCPRQISSLFAIQLFFWGFFVYLGHNLEWSPGGQFQVECHAWQHGQTRPTCVTSLLQKGFPGVPGGYQPCFIQNHWSFVTCRRSGAAFSSTHVASACNHERDNRNRMQCKTHTTQAWQVLLYKHYHNLNLI